MSAQAIGVIDAALTSQSCLPSVAKGVSALSPVAAEQLGLEATIAQPQSVTLPDDRRPAPNTTTAPWSRVCHIYAEGVGGSIFGTAWLAGPATVITAAHCLVDARVGFRAKRVFVWAGRQGDNALAAWESAQMAVHPQWTDAAPEPFDVGVIRLPDGAAADIGWIRFTAPADQALDRLVVRCSGYPEDAFGHQLFCDSPIGSVRSQTVSYALDTFRGQSGSPIYALDPAGDAVVVAIHVTGNDTQNVGVRINNDLFKQLMQWWR